MASGSEQISKRWIEGAKRSCVKCGVKITNLDKQIGEVRSRYPGPVREIICKDCLQQKADELVERTRREMEQKRDEDTRLEPWRELLTDPVVNEHVWRMRDCIATARNTLEPDDYRSYITWLLALLENERSSRGTNDPGSEV